MNELMSLRDEARRKSEKWLREIDFSPRSTLAVGIVQESCRYAEELVRRSAAALMKSEAAIATNGLEVISNGKKKSFERLTFGECLSLLVYLDAQPGVLHKKRLITKADKGLLERLSRSRNDFVHGSPGLDPNETWVKQLLGDVRALCDLRIVEHASITAGND